MTTESVNEGDAKFAPGAVVFNSFTVISSIGHGGMGSVYKVHHGMLDLDMALKVLNKGSASSADFIRFQNEARTLSKLSHNNVARVYDFGIEDGTPYLAMDFIEGQTLEQYLEQHGILSLTEFVVIFSQICSGLAHAHSRNTVHRDLKPGNIILSEDDNENIRAVIVDFGVAKLQEEMHIGQLTQAGAFIGSPLCSSPEQIDGGQITTAADMYALGCTMFAALTGDFPFRGETVLETLSMHRDMEPPLEKLSSDIPEKIRDVIAMLLKKDPAARKWTAKQLEEALDSGRLMKQTDQSSEIAVTIPPRLRRIVSNEATAARIKLNFDLPTTKTSKFQITKKEVITFVSAAAALGGFAALVYYANILPSMKQNVGTTDSGNTSSPMVQAVLDYTEKMDPNGKASPQELAALDEDPRSDQIYLSYQSAVAYLRGKQFGKSSQMFNDLLKIMGTRTHVGKTRRVDILCYLAAGAYIQGKSVDFKKYFKMYLDCVDPESRGSKIVRMAKDTAALLRLFSKPDEAIRCYRHFIDLEESKSFPAVKGALLTEIGLVEQAKGSSTKALEAYKQSIDFLKASNLTDSIYYLQALTYAAAQDFQLGKFDESRANCEEVDRLVPTDDEEVPFKDQKEVLILSCRLLVQLDISSKNYAGVRAHADRGLKLAKMLNHKEDGLFFKQVLDSVERYDKTQRKSKAP